MNRHWPTLLVWLAVSFIAALSCSLNRLEAHIGNEYFPMGNDAYYHGARILEAVHDPASFYEFDTKIHAPEGSLLTWPWGYDYVMAKLVRFVMHTGLADDPVQILLWIPLAGVFVAIGLLIVIARQLGLSTWPTALAALCMALMPTTQWIFGFGQIDHHGAEMTFVLATIATGVAWLRRPGTLTGVALGVTFALALGVHNGLFILQLPFLITLFVLWLQNRRTEPLPTVVLVMTQLALTLAILMPSMPFRLGLFEFYTLSWFHLYIAACTSLFVLLMSRIPPSRASIAGFCVLGALLLAPLLHQIMIGASFVSGSLGILVLIQEMQSPVTRILNGEAEAISMSYSWLIWLTPATIALCLIKIWQRRHTSELLFWTASAAGLVLLTMQMRMHYFGSYALYLPWLVVIDEFVKKRPSLYKRTFLVSTLALLLAYSLQLRHVLVAPMPRGGDTTFAPLYPVFPALRKACEKNPGVVLADADAGHYIRYFTKCSVIANNFLLTEQHFAKVDQMLHLLASTPEQVRDQAPFVKYVLLRPAKVIPHNDGSVDYSFFVPGLPQLAKSLLLGTSHDVPPEYKLIYYINYQIKDRKGSKLVPYARLYEIDRPAAPDRQSGSGVTN